MREFLKEIDWNCVFINEGDSESNWEKFFAVISRCIISYVPLSAESSATSAYSTSIRSSKRKKSVPKCIRRLTAKKNCTGKREKLVQRLKTKPNIKLHLLP